MPPRWGERERERCDLSSSFSQQQRESTNVVRLVVCVYAEIIEEGKTRTLIRNLFLLAYVAPIGILGGLASHLNAYGWYTISRLIPQQPRIVKKEAFEDYHVRQNSPEPTHVHGGHVLSCYRWRLASAPTTAESSINTSIS